MFFFYFFVFIYFVFLFFILTIDSGLESDFVQDATHFGNEDNSPTVEDGTQQDETKNGHLGNCPFVTKRILIFLICFTQFVLRL